MGLWGLCDEDIGVAGSCSVGSVGSVCHTKAGGALVSRTQRRSESSVPEIAVVIGWFN